MTKFYEMGLEPVTDQNGWAVFTGCEGETPDFVAFFVDEKAANAFAKSLNEDPEFGNQDAFTFLAVLTSDMGIVAENDFELQTHEQLRERIQEARAAGLAEELR